MAECPICRRTYDDRFKVFVPPHTEAFDTIECARSSARAGGAVKSPYVPVILPTIEVVRPAAAGRTPARRAGIGAGAFAPAQLALAGGVGLLAAGTAAAVYLATQPPSKLSHSTTIAAGAGASLPNRPAGTLAEPRTSSPERPTPQSLTLPKKSVRPTRPSRAVVPRGAASGEHPTAQLASRVIPSTSSAPSSSKTSTPPQPATSRRSPPATSGQSPSPTTHRTPRPKAPTPSSPTPPSPAPATPAPPPATTEVPVSTAEVAVVSATKAPVHQKSGKKPPPAETPPPTEPPPSSPPPSQPPSTAGPSEPQESDDSTETRPGHGWGDSNHEHTGPPGHESGDDKSKGDPSGSGSQGNGNGNGHGHGH